MPQDDRLGAGQLERVDRVAVAVAAREDDDADADRHAQPSPAPAADGGRRRAERLDREDLDQRVRQQLGGEPLDDRPGRRLVVGVDGQLDPPADADVADPLDPEVAEAALDRPTLRVEDARASA